MNKEELELLLNGDLLNKSSILEQFVAKHSQTFDFTGFNQSGQFTPIWNAVFNILQTPAARKLYPNGLSAIRILSRDKTYLNQVITNEQFDCLLDIGNIGSNNIDCPIGVSVEALKCLCNLVFQSTKCQEMCLKNSSIEGIVKRLRTYKAHNVNPEIQFFDMKLLFLITALNPNVRTKICDDFHGLTYLVETLDIIIKENNELVLLNDKQVDLLCEILKVLFNITVRDETSVPTEEEEELQFRRLAVVLHDLLLCRTMNREKQNELLTNSVNLLTNIPTGCFTELITSVNVEAVAINSFEGHDMLAVDILIDYLRSRLDNVEKLSAQLELLSPILTALIKCVRCAKILRHYIRSVILPPLRNVHTRPEIGKELRNSLCRFLTTPATQVRDLTAELLFIICKENVNRMIKYFGYGNASGLFANRGLMGGRTGQLNTEYSSDSEDSDTEEYKQIQQNINPVLGCYEAPHPNPFVGMTDEQKEYETMKLVDLMDQLNKQGVVQPCRIGSDGRPEPVEHILELQEIIPEQQKVLKRKI